MVPNMTVKEGKVDQLSINEQFGTVIFSINNLTYCSMENTSLLELWNRDSIGCSF